MKAVITVSDVAYTEFGGAIDGPWALITAAACEEFDPENPNDDLIHDTAYFFQLVNGAWIPTQQLEPVIVPGKSHALPGVAMRANGTVLQAGGLRIVERAAVVHGPPAFQ